MVQAKKVIGYGLLGVGGLIAFSALAGAEEPEDIGGGQQRIITTAGQVPSGQFGIPSGGFDLSALGSLFGSDQFAESPFAPYDPNADTTKKLQSAGAINVGLLAQEARRRNSLALSSNNPTGVGIANVATGGDYFLGDPDRNYYNFITGKFDIPKKKQPAAASLTSAEIQTITGLSSAPGDSSLNYFNFNTGAFDIPKDGKNSDKSREKFLYQQSKKLDNIKRQAKKSKSRSDFPTGVFNATVTSTRDQARGSVQNIGGKDVFVGVVTKKAEKAVA